LPIVNYRAYRDLCIDRRNIWLPFDFALQGAAAKSVDSNYFRLCTMASRRPLIHGRSILLGGRKLHVRGVTYGTFRPLEGVQFPAADAVRRDFEAIAAAGANALRTYLPPPSWLLELAQEHGLQVLVGLAWEQHVAFLDEPGRAKAIVAKVREQVRRCESHPAILGYAIGNEIPAPIVRWHGKRPTEKFLERLHWAVKEEDPEGLSTYVNYPSTEYLELPFLDLAAFNVFLEDECTFESYLARLQNLSGDRPLLITEVGIDSQRNGEEAQARALEWQVRHAFGTGAAGVFVFSWTDEWHRGGHDVLEWDFGVVDRERRPKPSLGVVREAFAEAPFPSSGSWPRISVVVCTHNGARTLPECLERLGDLAYPNYETIVVNDGSTDGSGDLARSYGVKVVDTAHRGLSFARNAGVEAVTGEIVAFLDDDAYPDHDWLHYVAASLREGSYAGIGGPNLPPPEDSLVAECVAVAPGAPIHVLISDREAEHLPGCNMAFRTAALRDVGGFDERFRAAGDDVDLCWRLQDAGETLGFSAGAVVTHRRRDTVRRYLKQQFGYGKAEALLEQKWPNRHNRAGYLRWAGRIYDGASADPGRRRARIRYGPWGSGLFQSIYEPAPGKLSALMLMPESYLLVMGIGVLGAFGLMWSELLLALPIFALGVFGILWRACASGWRAHRPAMDRSALDLLRRRLLTGALFLLQPLARLAGRLLNGLSPWRRRAGRSRAVPLPRTACIWSERWRAHAERLEELQKLLVDDGAIVKRGGAFDRWDLHVRPGPLGGARLRTAVEEHGDGKQLTRVKVWPNLSLGAAVIPLLLGFSVMAWFDGELPLAASLGLLAVVPVLLAASDCSAAVGMVLRDVSRLGQRERARAAEPAPEAEDLSLPDATVALAAGGSSRLGDEAEPQSRVLSKATSESNQVPP
jgi:GT2 family glycosyltransferase